MIEAVSYVNGEFVPASEAALPLNDLGVVRGYGVFDVLRTYGSTPFRLREHVERLLRSAAQIELNVPYSVEEIEAIVHETLRRNSATDVTVRLIVTGGPTEDLITPQETPSLVVMLRPAPPDPSVLYGDGSKAITVELERFMPGVKSLNYITAIMGRRRAAAAGALEALYIDAAGNVTEGMTTSFCVFRGNRLITPRDGVLDGITRDAVLEIAAELFEVAREPIARASLSEVDEAFLTSTAKDIVPIVQIDDVQIGDGTPGPNTRLLLERFQKEVQTLARVHSS